MPPPDGLGGYVLAALLGLIFGSFSTAASYRLPRGLPLGAARSACGACQHPLTAPDLIPVLSWCLSKGRCRHCGQRVSWRYPAIEIATALLFALCWHQSHGAAISAALLALMGTALIVITVADLECRIIPDAATLCLALCAALWRWQQALPLLDGLLTGVAAMALAMALRWLFARLRGVNALGLGDVKFLGAAGLALGSGQIAPFLILSGLLGVAFGLVWRLAGRGSVFPFGPALAAALGLLLLFPIG
ncbi:type 4 prepilin-like protein leader peptide-processing enzyme [mine drainage metagenome]|uniref:Type 4 prepilin-like protein leader peptide-processing enzyme n=1 Tax=mine drainage metagenome TaxID=410659 RepID=A0A1J5QJU9_9ZZZZ